MWKCENDILKDIAYLNDFGDDAPEKILYSNGRGKKIRLKEKSPEKFTDPRTGEVIDISDSELSYNDNFYTGKGRGRHLASFSNKHYQLQEQLRLARPMGSGDEAMESFCRRFRVDPNAGDATSTSDSDADLQNASSSSKTSKPTTRVIGSRNSVLQSNALIRSLLSKTGDNRLGQEVTNNVNPNSNTEDDDDDDDDNDDKNSRSDVTSEVSAKSGSVLSDNDFPPLRTCSKKPT